MTDHPVRQLEALAAWCDSDSSPDLEVSIGGRPYSPGYLLRAIAAALSRAERNNRQAQGAP